MKKLVCEVCGGSQIVKNGEYFICNDCGCNYSAQQVKNLLVEVPDSTATPTTSPVPAPTTAPPANTVDTELQNLYVLARRAREQNNAENAARYYDLIAMKEPNNWEANFFQVFYQSSSCRIANILSAANTFANCQGSTISLIRQNVASDAQHSAVLTVVQYTIGLASGFFNSAENFYNGIDNSIRYQHLQEFYDRATAACECIYVCGNSILEQFMGNEKIVKLAVKAWETANTLCERLIPYASNKQALWNVVFEYRQKMLDNDRDLQEMAKADQRKNDNQKIAYIRSQIVHLQNLKRDAAQNKSFRAIMFTLAAVAALGLLLAFAYCSKNLIPLGMILCFLGAIIAPILLVKIALSRPVPPKNVDAQIRELKADLERRTKKEENS